MAQPVKSVTIFFIALAVSSGEAMACSCPTVPSVAASFAQASAIFEGTVLSRNLTTTPGIGVVESAVFSVEKAWKGVRGGQIIRIRSHVSPGACGMSCRNDPPWLIEKPSIASAKRTGARISDRWLVYAFGREPYELSLCTRSLPLNVQTANNDIAALNAISAVDRRPGQ